MFSDRALEVQPDAQLFAAVLQEQEQLLAREPAEAVTGCSSPSSAGGTNVVDVRPVGEVVADAAVALRVGDLEVPERLVWGNHTPTEVSVVCTGSVRRCRSAPTAGRFPEAGSRGAERRRTATDASDPHESPYSRTRHALRPTEPCDGRLGRGAATGPPASPPVAGVARPSRVEPLDSLRSAPLPRRDRITAFCTAPKSGVGRLRDRRRGRRRPLRARASPDLNFVSPGRMLKESSGARHCASTQMSRATRQRPNTTAESGAAASQL